MTNRVIHLLSQKHRRRDNYWTFHSIKQGCICMLQSEPELRNMRASERARTWAKWGELRVWKHRQMKICATFLDKIFTMVEENFVFWRSENAQNEDMCPFSYKIFTMVEENFEFWVSKNAQVKICVIFLDKIFTMVEENFEFRVSENAKNENMWHFF